MVSPLLLTALVAFFNAASQSLAFTGVAWVQRPVSSLKAAKKKGSSTPFELPANEFSRLVQPDRVLRPRRSYHMELEATEDERLALAHRFDLSEIASLEAHVELRPEANQAVEVQGSVTASVTQRCVRTNEDFQVNVEFPLYSLVRPVRAGDEDAEAVKDMLKDTYRREKSVDQMDLMELQRLLEVDLNDEEDALMEDEAIYVIDGPLDVGELVAQLFWLKLDPYPKKPGSDPVQRSISG